MIIVQLYCRYKINFPLKINIPAPSKRSPGIIGSIKPKTPSIINIVAILYLSLENLTISSHKGRCSVKLLILQ